MRYEHIDGVDVTAQFSHEGESRYRNRLEITLKEATSTSKTVCAVMQNPSYAGEDAADKSVSHAQRRFKLGYTRVNSIMEAMDGEIVTTKDASGWRSMLTGETKGRD